jgi:excisionase family DNA binding protein
MDQHYFKPKQLAAFLGICERQVRYWMAEGVLPYVKIGGLVLFDIHKVQAALEKFERKAVA